MNINDKTAIKKILESSRKIVGDHWLYTGSLDTYGYGQLGIDYAVYKVNRLSLYVYTDNFDILNPKVLALHKCSETSCFAPHHLKSGDYSENTLDSVKDETNHNRNKTSCKNGHQLTEDNVYNERKRNGRIQRHCKICRARRLREMRARQKDFAPLGVNTGFKG